MMKRPPDPGSGVVVRLPFPLRRLSLSARDEAGGASAGVRGSKNMQRLEARRLRGLAAALLLLASCSMKTVQEEPIDAGESERFDAPYAEVVQAALEGVTRAKLDTTRQGEEADGFVILFVRPTSAINWGGVGRVVVDKSAAPPTVVHISYDRRLPLPAADRSATRGPSSPG